MYETLLATFEHLVVLSDAEKQLITELFKPDSADL